MKSSIEIRAQVKSVLIRMDVNEFLAWHPYLDEKDFKSMKLYTRFNKS